MIFGKSKHQIKEEEQDYLKSLFEKEYEAYAYFPTWLEDGRMIIFQKYYYKYDVTYNGYRYDVGLTFWLDRIAKKKYLK